MKTFTLLLLSFFLLKFQIILYAKTPEEKDLGCITLLVESGADSTLKNKKGQTAAAVAEEYGQAEAVALLTGNKLSSRK